VDLTPEEEALVLSGEHPAVGLFVHKETGEPQLRLVRPVTRGAILGQLATRVSPAALAHCVLDPVDDETLAAYRRNCFAVDAEFETDVLPKERPGNDAAFGSVQLDDSQLQGAAGQERDPREFWAFYKVESSKCEVRDCKHADPRFTDAIALEEHLEALCSSAQALDKKFLCPWVGCSEVWLSSRQNLRYHLKGVHGGLGRRCPTCGCMLRIPEIKAMREHVRDCEAGRIPAPIPRVLNSAMPHDDDADDADERALADAAPGGVVTFKKRRKVKLRFDVGEACNLLRWRGAASW
jgi:hypothetical protein